jgi:hypothetical protein
MRLTLRTLLAWLDDTLPAAEVRDIGKQVAESPYAQELVERIHRVTRQRRLTVPSRNGPEGTDPNEVAAYVDNGLEPNQVAEYEKKCLNSDVNLAEAASVHQILSLLGQKVHVPGEAKARMYHLVRGREATAAPRRDGVKPPPHTPVTRPIQPWVAPEPPRRNLLERFGPAAACIALIGVLCWSAYESLSPSSPQPVPAVAEPSGPAPQPEASPAGPAPDPLALSRDAEGKEAASTPTGAGTERMPAAEPDTAKTAEGAAKPAPKAEPAPKAIPAGAVGVVEKADGVLLRFSPEKRTWERIGEGTSLEGSDRLLCLAPFRARIAIGKAPITLIGETQLRLATKSQGDDPAFELRGGRVVVDGSAPTGHLKVEFAGQSADIDRPTQVAVALERVAAWHPGQPAKQPPALAIHVADGELTVALDRAKETLRGPGTLVADAAGKLQVGPEKSGPTWVNESGPSPKDQQLGEQFLKEFSPDRPALADIVEAIEDESPVTKKLAIQALKALGDLSLLTPILSRQGDPDARQSTAAALRAYLAEGPQAEKDVLEQLKEELGDETGVTVLKLLSGYSQDEASKPETLRRLVELLSPRDPSLPARELALEELRRLTGRETLGYDPEKPDDKSYGAWKALLNAGELRPAARRKADR